jgi:predicted hydrocarbon binding protein
MGLKEIGMIEEILGNIERFSGKKIKDQIIIGAEKLSPNTKKPALALWVKNTVAKMDNLVDEKTRLEIMENCGYSCAKKNKRVIETMKTRSDKHKTLDDFIEAEIKKPLSGTRLERKGNILYQYYTPQSFSRPMRCYCSLVNGLPLNETMSATYCHCSKGFVKKLWEAVLKRSVKVELLQSVLSGQQECKFAIHF